MTYCVCKNKDDGSLFITTAAARETMINVLIELKQQPDSIVLKRVDSYSEAIKYKKNIEDADKKINDLI